MLGGWRWSSTGAARTLYIIDAAVLHYTTTRTALRPPATSRSDGPLLAMRNEQLVTDLVTAAVGRSVRLFIARGRSGPVLCGPVRSGLVRSDPRSATRRTYTAGTEETRSVDGRASLYTVARDAAWSMSSRPVDLRPETRPRTTVASAGRRADRSNDLSIRRRALIRVSPIASRRRTELAGRLRALRARM